MRGELRKRRDTWKENKDDEEEKRSWRVEEMWGREGWGLKIDGEGEKVGREEGGDGDCNTLLVFPFSPRLSHSHLLS